jgi:biopolymer transport protein ExbD
VKLTPIQKRAERRSRNQTMVDMNLVSLIDVFTILIFFLLSSATGVEVLQSPKAVKLPESIADQMPKETHVVVVSESDILVDGRRVATVSEAAAVQGDLIPGLKAELDLLVARPALRTGKTETESRALTIMGDRGIPYSLLRKVMVTSARAGFANVSFAVRRKDGT